MDHKNDVKQFVSHITRYVKETNASEESLPKVQKLFETLSLRAANDRIARVTTAIPLSKENSEQIQRVISELIGQEFSIMPIVDKTVLGGMKVHIGDWVFDATVSYQLSILTRELRI